MAKDIPAAVRAVVVDRASDTPSMMPVCEALITGVCGYRPSHWHHRLMRSQGGPHTVENGLYICDACHEWIHVHPAISYKNGWLIRRGGDPASTKVLRRGKEISLKEMS